ncbi:MAG: cytochrome c-type biogenesis protein CcmE [Cyclobacteriaceae bacterium]
MKKTHIIGIVVIAIAIVVIISTAGDASTYVNFDDAKEMYQAGNKNKIHVVGQLKKDNTGNVVGIETSADMLSFKFTMLDEHNIEQVVFHPNPMPTDFLRSEQVVVVGAYQNEKFVADKILLKCPSKYQEEGIKV